MQNWPCVFLVLSSLLLCTPVKSQKTISIPAYTAYAVPADESTETDDSDLFSINNGIHNWTNPKQQIQFNFKIRNKGELQISFFTKNKQPGSRVSVSVAGKVFTVMVPQSNSFQLVKIGTVQIIDSGFYVLTISSSQKNTALIADIKSLELNGEAAKNIHFNANARRNAASVHLLYPVPDSLRIISFYNEINIPEGSDALHSYFMACGFARGYFGIQVISKTERRVIFSVWDAGNETADRNKVADDNKVKLIAKGEDVFADGFGNEGTGGHSHWVFNWKTNETYKFLVTAYADSVSNSTTYTGYFFIPDIQKWKMIASFKAPKDGKPIRKLYSFVENFWGANGQVFRKAYFGNQWVRHENGAWHQLTLSKFSYDATGKAGDRIDYGAGTENNMFYLWNGGFKSSNTQFNDSFIRQASIEKPAIDLNKNADSLTEAQLEHDIILDAIRKGQFDTTGSINGVYYKILKPGSGDQVALSDTIVVFYKGQLLNGTLFDETKQIPARFPLNRLIKGWQIALPFCKQGGKIRLIIPSASGYSIKNSGIITPNSILVFEVEVVDIKKQQ